MWVGVGVFVGIGDGVFVFEVLFVCGNCVVDVV